ncbi:MAG TPA: M3 family oligoendopeptidase [Acholeplasmataceae bacterium]|nr:M3 family oligoendopeptidase [Acholeplasmataceae bacterium]
MYTWNLKSLYKGLDDLKFSSDQNKLDKKILEFNSLVKSLNNNHKENLKLLLKKLEEIELLADKFAAFVRLNIATDTTNKEFNNAMVVLNQKFIKMALPQTLFEKYIAGIENLNDVIDGDDYLKEHEFFLTEIKENSKYLLSDEEEVLIAELNQSGGSLFSKMQSNLTSTLQVDYQDKVIGLSEVRNLAYSDDPKVRRDAYIAEVKSYKKINKAMSFALNGIKKQVLTLSKKRGYKSPLDETLKRSRINGDVLNSLISAMKSYLPHFRQYLQQKAKILGHDNGLPFYDLFAPIGKANKKYTIEEAQKVVLDNFKTFSPDLHDLAYRAFTEDWIDYLPRQGKTGGAFCFSIYPIKESRILTNFDGTISDISTLAHELGHAYHNFILFDERPLNTNYPMPIAETASILCETIVKHSLLERSENIDEKLSILEQELQDSTQVVVDILSRYIFETNVFYRVEHEFLDETTLNQIMIDAQKEAYGDGLDQNYLNEGMWICKSHYYSTGRSFYNFPYAFGLLFSKGIYAQYLKKKDAFVPELRKLLRMTGKASLIDVAKTIGIDITSVDFWKSSLEVIKDDINQFIQLTK